MLVKKLLLVAFLSMICMVQACATSINRQNAAKHAQAAGRAIQAGDWDTARREWAQAVKNGELGHIPEKHQAIFYYEYGRASGVTCFFDISETYLNKAYELDKQIDGPFFLSLVELFRLNLDQKKFDKAVSYFEKALVALEKINAPSESPAEFSRLLDEYAIALDGIGKKAKALEIKKRSARVRVKAVNSITDRTPYGSNCSKN